MSKFKTLASKVNASPSIITRDVVKLTVDTQNVYESINVIGRRARQVSVALKEELQEKLAEFATLTDNLEEIHENREQIEISKFYERMPKPTAVAIEEFKANKVFYRYPEKELAEGEAKTAE